ncbi:Uncharacterised protein [Pandoraea pulmonicola]|nr:Uncharacterised protein [Pandoraea pulmonicola]
MQLTFFRLPASNLETPGRLRATPAHQLGLRIASTGACCCERLTQPLDFSTLAIDFLDHLRELLALAVHLPPQNFLAT